MSAVPAGGLSLVGKLNVLLFVTALALVGGAVYLQRTSRRPDPGLAAHLTTLGSVARQQADRALDGSLWAFQRVSELGTSAGDLLVERTLAAWRWAGEMAVRLDLLLTDKLGEPWPAAKASVTEAGHTLSQHLHRAGEKALALLAYGVRRGWETTAPLLQEWAEAGRQAAAHGWERAAPLLQEWTETGRRAALTGWETVRRETPRYVEAAWETACRLSLQAWELCCHYWELACTELPVYAHMAAERVTKLVASVTG